MLDSPHTLLIKLGLLTCIICSSVISITSSFAASEKYVTFYIESEDTNAFDLKQVQKNVSNALAKSGVTALSFKPSSEAIYAQRRPFEKDESARVKATISPGTIIKGSHFSSFPVTVTISIISANQRDAINPIVESARTQHTNNIKGLTDAVSKALKLGLSRIGNDIAKLEPNVNTGNDTHNPEGNISESGSNGGVRDQLASNDTTNSRPNQSEQPTGADNTQSMLPPQDLTQCDKSVTRSRLMVSPSSVVSRGESLTVISCYRTEFDGDQQVRIKTTIKSKSDSRKTLLNSEDYVLASGYWKSTFNFDVPTSIAPDTYTLAQAIYRQGRVEYLKLDLTIK